MQVHDAGLAGDHTGYVSIARYAQQLVQRWLARTMIAQSQLADTDDRIEEYDVVTDAASQCHRRHVVTARMAPGAESLFTQSARLCEQAACIACRIIGAEHANDAGDPGGREAPERQRRHAAGEPGLPASAARSSLLSLTAAILPAATST